MGLIRSSMVCRREGEVSRRLCAILFLSLAFLSAGCSHPKDPDVAVGNLDYPNLSTHPIYKDYIFSGEENVIDFGEQPLWIPTSSISEVMKRDNILKEELSRLGYSLKVHPFLKGNDVNYFLKRGDLEAGIGGDMPALRAAAESNAIIVAIIQDGPVSIVSRDIAEVRGLKGKKIAYALGSNAHFYLLNTLKKNGIEISDVKLVQMDVDSMPGALEDRSIDAFSAWEPTPKITLEKNPNFIVTHKGRSYGFLYVSQDLLERSPEGVYHLLASEIRAIWWLRNRDENIERAGEWAKDSSLLISPGGISLSEHLIMDLTKKDLPGIRTREYPRIPLDLLSDFGALEMEFEFLREQGFVSKEKTWEDVRKNFDLSVIETVISNPEKYRIFEDMGEVR